MIGYIPRAMQLCMSVCVWGECVSVCVREGVYLCVRESVRVSEREFVCVFV